MAKVVQPSFGDMASGWQGQILSGIHAPTTQSDVNFMNTWATQEGGAGYANTAWYNPLNTTLKMPGSSTIPGNTAGVQAYTSQSQGIQATVDTLNNTPAYAGIKSTLQKGNASQTTLKNAVSSTGSWTNFGTSATGTASGSSGSSTALGKVGIGPFSIATSYLIRGGLMIFGAALFYAGITKMFSGDGQIGQVLQQVPAAPTIKPITTAAKTYSPVAKIRTISRVSAAKKVAKSRETERRESATHRETERRATAAVKAEQYTASRAGAAAARATEVRNIESARRTTVRAKAKADTQTSQARLAEHRGSEAAKRATLKARSNANTRKKIQTVRAKISVPGGYD